MGWFTVVAYLAAAGLCAAAARSTGNRTRLDDRERRLWLALTIILLVLGINKQLDLQALLTEVARAAAKDEGWYGQRRHYQLVFVGMTAMAGIASLSLLLWWMRNADPPVKLAVLGLALTSTFVVVRAASFHHVDLWLKHDISGQPWNSVIELAGIATIAAGAVWCKLQPGRRDG